MSRSADRRTLAVLAVAALTAALTSALPAAAGPAPSPSPVAGTVQSHTGGVDGPVLDIITIVTSLDGTRTTVDRGPTRRLVLDSSVLFAPSSPVLSPAAVATLADAARQIRASGARGQVTVDGYTDDQGSAAIGLTLSHRRSAAVTAVLARDLAGTGLAFVQHGYGEAHPIAPNEHADGSPDRAGQARNRRVEISFTPAAT